MELVHTLKPAPGANAHAEQQRPLLLLGDVHPQLPGRDQLVLAHPVDGLGRRLAGEAEIDGGAEGIDIRPGALPPVLILLNGRIAVLEGDGHGGVAAGGLPGAAEVQKAHRALLQHEIIRADIPMDESQRVHGAQGAKERLENGEELLRRDAAAALIHPGFEVRAVHVLHDDVRRFVLFKKVPDADDLRALVHLGHGARLVEEPRLPLLEALGHFSGKLRDAVGCLCHSGHLIRGEEFLNSHPQLQAKIIANIGDAEAALPQDAPHQIPSQENGAGQQMMGQGRIGALGEPAHRAGLSRLHRAHAIGTVVAFHGFAAPLVVKSYLKMGNALRAASSSSSAPPRQYRSQWNHRQT